ncbi:MAG: hypothetical protein AAFV62_12265 [Pseudomonadota bacterium]
MTTSVVSPTPRAFGRSVRIELAHFSPSYRWAAIIALTLLAGTAATAVWEVWARLAAPLWIGGPLEPAGLIRSVFANAGGVQISALTAEWLHFVTGLIAYPAAYLVVARPVARGLGRVLPQWLRWITAPVLVGAVYGAALFAFALYLMAHLLAGFPPFLGWGQLAFASLTGHVLYGVAVALVVWKSRSH